LSSSVSRPSRHETGASADYAVRRPKARNQRPAQGRQSIPAAQLHGELRAGRARRHPTVGRRQHFGGRRRRSVLLHRSRERDH